MGYYKKGERTLKRKKYRLLLTIVVLAIVCLCATLVTKHFFVPGADDRSGATIEDSTVGFLLSSDEDDSQNELDGACTLWKGRWDIKAGTITYDTTPVLIMGGPNRRGNILAWDGGNQYIIWDPTYIVQQDDSARTVPYLEAYEDGTQVIWGPGYQIKLSSTSQCTVVQEGADPVFFENIDHKFTIDNDTVELQNLRFLGCELADEQLVLVYAYFYDQGERGVMLYAALDLPTLDISWSKPIQVPDAYCGGLFFCYCPYYPLLDQKLYFSAGDTVAYLDLNRDQIVALEKLPSQVEKLLPVAERTSFHGREFPVELVGRTSDVVIASIGYLESDSDSSHEVYLAIQGDRIIGTLDEHRQSDQTTLAVYKEDLEKTAQVELPFVDPALQWEMVVSPWP